MVTGGGGERFIIGAAYINRATPMDDTLARLEAILSEISERFADIDVFIVGDFNSRVGDLYSALPECAQQCGLELQRGNMDGVADGRGRALLGFLEEESGFTLLNGRTPGDRQGVFTYVGPGGCSSIDLAFCNASAIHRVVDMQVMDPLSAPGAFHRPICVTCSYLSLAMKQSTSRTVDGVDLYKLRWSADRITDYQSYVRIAIQNTSDKSAETFTQTILKAADNSGMGKNYRKPSLGTQKTHNKPWFNSACYHAKRNIKITFRLCKRGGFSPPLLRTYCDAKKTYSKEIQSAKNYYEKNTSKILDNVRNGTEFWEAIRKFKNHNQRTKIQIDPIEYFEYLSLNNPVVSESKSPYPQAVISDPELDSEFKYEELDLILHNLKNGKACGPDKISNEFIKNLPKVGKEFLLNLLNQILELEKVPAGWVDAEIFLVFKKGDPVNPVNYRGIFLLNSILKILTQLLNARLAKWAESRKIIPEGQNGFRAGRGCSDGLFTLMCLIHLQLLQNRKLYVAFIDFARCFDLIDPALLWSKLVRLGVSSKIVNLFKNIYSQARARAKINEEHTNYVNITQGVLQGDPASPTLFSLFTQDLPEYLTNSGCSGVAIDHTTEVSCLMYADDLGVLAYSKVDLQKKLNFLHQYCFNNKLTVNKSKSKIMIFRKGGRCKASDKFFFDGEPIEVVNKFTYLGIPFTPRGVFAQAANSARLKGNCAGNSLLGIITKSKMTSWESIAHLNSSMILSTLLYSSEIWALRYLTQLDVAQNRFLKTLLCWPRSTPHYLVRAETGVAPVGSLILRSALIWWIKLLRMQDDRFPKKCYQKLMTFNPSPENEKYNWPHQLKQILCSLGFGDLWSNPDASVIKSKMKEILREYDLHSKKEDLIRIQNSSYSFLYKSMPEKSNAYLFKPMGLWKKKMVSQLRIQGREWVSLFVNGSRHTWPALQPCIHCNTNSENDLFHFLFECTIFTHIRLKYLVRHRNGVTRENLGSIFNFEGPTKINDFVYYLCEAIKLKTETMNVT